MKQTRLDVIPTGGDLQQKRLASEGIRCLIIHHRTFGMRHDALVLAQAIWKALPTSDILTWELSLPILQHLDEQRVPELEEIGKLLPFDVVFFLEHLRPIRTIWTKNFARRIVFVPNIEWITPDDEMLLNSLPVHAVMFKNRFSHECANNIAAFRSILHKSVVGWTSIDIGTSGDPLDTSRFDRFLHVRGLSRQKQTELVMKTWLKNPDFPVLEIVCSGSDGFEFPAPAMIGGNIKVHFCDMPTPQLRQLQKQSGIHLIPSAAEGFGHALNEARAAAAVLVTTDGPPMNDFVRDGTTGILVPVRLENVESFGPSKAFPVTEEDLVLSVQRIRSCSASDLAEMGIRARAAFSEDRHNFQNAVHEFIDHVV